MEEDRTVPTLNELIETCKDGQEGFRTASEGISRSDLKNLFQNYAEQRAQFARELEDHVRFLGGEPETNGSVAGALHRGWINIKSAATGKDDEAIIAECERGEDSAVKNYTDALEINLAPSAQMIVNRQNAEVKAAHDRIRSLEQALSRGA
jgi:uncharacterized protein (TIGR02284 family)